MSSGDVANGGIIVREVTASDLNFIYATWKRGVYYGGLLYETKPIQRHIPSQIFYRAFSQIIEQTLNRPGIIVNIACLSDAPEVILGFAVFEHEPLVDGWVVHWTHVKDEWRRSGIAKRLLPATVKIVTHLTTQGLLCMPKGVIFNPFYPNFVEPKLHE